MKKIKQINQTIACPISLDQVDKNLIKLYSSFVLAVLVVALLTPFKIGIYLITIDFIIRVFIGIKYSPLCMVLTKSLKIVAIKKVLIDSGRKKIAAQVGLMFSVLISISYIMGYAIIANVLALFFISAISLDLVFNYCLACKMQSLYYRYFKI